MAECMDESGSRWEGRCTAGYNPETETRVIKNVLGKTQADVQEKLVQTRQGHTKGWLSETSRSSADV